MTQDQIVSALQILSPGANWSIRGDNYSDIEWLDSVQKQPTEQQITAIASTAKSTLAVLNAHSQSESLVVSGSDPYSTLLRASVLVILDELNILRQRTTDIATDVSAATSLADLKLRWATRPSLTDRTVIQMKTAIQSKIISGTGD